MGGYGSKEVVVAGAGLSGLTAALNLARDGKDVTVLEKFERPGGIPLTHPAVDATPMDPGPLGKFIGVDLGEPQVWACKELTAYAYDYKVPMAVEATNVHCVERGHRKTALDVQIYELCVDAGVKFEFNHPLVGQKDFAQLPVDSIIATGLYVEAFEAFHIPYEKVFGYLGKGRSNKDYPCVAAWFHDYTLDYAYYAACNDAIFCLYFAREPVKKDEFDRFCEKQLLGQEGMECQRWDYYEGLVPTAAYNTPKLFAGDKILAGTASGMMDPFALFGVHGSLISGKIAAIAHQDKAEAFRLFKQFSGNFNRSLRIRRIFNATPVVIKKMVLGPGLAYTQKHIDKFEDRIQNMNKTIPGYRQLPT